MKFSYWYYIATLLALLLATGSNAKVIITATNTSQHQRQEVVAWNAKDVWQRLGVKEGSSLIVKNPYGQTVTHQITHDGRLLLDVSVRPKGTAEFTVEQGNCADFKPYVFGKQYAWRVDDITWENDIAAYRVYGPALQRSGEKAFGIDVWLKSTKELDVDHRYAVTWQSNIDKAFFRSIGNQEGVDFVDRATSFHLDHGQGLDCYNVGPSMGCGTPAVMIGDSLVMPYCYKDYEILDNGPLEFTLSLTYPTVDIAGQNVTEHRLISLAKGSNFNRMTVWYDGLTRPMDVAGGLVVHTSALEDLTLGKDFIAYDDPTDSYERHNFQITLFNPIVGTILSWPREVKPRNWPHNTIMDNMMNLDMMFWAAKNGGNPLLYDLAVTHAKTTMQNHFRPDGSCYHVAVYDTINGNLIKGVTHQGYADNSMWARGQSWAIYGYTMVYRYTHNKVFLDFAQKVTDVYLKRLKQTSDDLIPLWDMDDPRGMKAPKDASAACVVADALLELQEYVGGMKGAGLF